MIKAKFVFVILVYRNYDDLLECIESIKEKVNDYQIIVVNAFYDDESKAVIEKIANDNGCHFINIPNKGYSYGNNRGIEHAQKNIDYEYIVVSNPDIIIKNFDEDILDNNQKFSIIAPMIIARNGKKQNPISAKRNKLKEKMEYKAFTKGKKITFYFAILLGKLGRYFSLFKHLNKNKPYQIYAAHGSFVIFRKSAIETLWPVYDENMFLFGEEGVLAFRAKQKGVITGQFNKIVINHKEDGSMKLSDLHLDNEVAKATIYYYENYVKKENKKTE